MHVYLQTLCLEQDKNVRNPTKRPPGAGSRHGKWVQLKLCANSACNLLGSRRTAGRPLTRLVWLIKMAAVLYGPEGERILLLFRARLPIRLVSSMVPQYYDLPSMTALTAFEASARNLSFQLAASELGVTSAEISRQIKTIEDDLGVPLFVRRGTGVMLTSAGKDIFSALASSLSKASDVVRTMKRGRPGNAMMLRAMR